ncbi:MAG TPA: VOC family protein [Steroidobacteraceae bacterium]|nr:VOC family protein [Steroidobacteraceae bacterium]
MSLRFAHTNIRVKDPAASLRFYRVLGMELVGCLVMSERYYLLYLGTRDDDQTTIELTVNETGGKDYDRSPGSGHFALAVGDLDACVAALDAASFKTEQAPFNPNGRADLRVCFVADPDGHRIELIDGRFPTPDDDLPATIRSLSNLGYGPYVPCAPRP